MHFLSSRQNINIVNQLMSVKKTISCFFYRLSNITVSCVLEYGCNDLGSILTKSHKLRCDYSFICGDDTYAKEFKNRIIQNTRIIFIWFFVAVIDTITKLKRTTKILIKSNNHNV